MSIAAWLPTTPSPRLPTYLAPSVLSVGVFRYVSIYLIYVSIFLIYVSIFLIYVSIFLIYVSIFLIYVSIHLIPS